MKIKVVFLFMSVGFLHAVDLPQFYRVPFFQDQFGISTSKYTTGLSVRYGHGSTRKGWDGHNEIYPLLSTYGYLDITNLGTRITSDDALIRRYWQVDNHPGDAPIFPANYTKANPNDGLIEFSGKFKIDEWDFTLQQSLFWGFFIQAYIPYREIKIDRITYKNLGSAILRGGNIVRTPVNVEDFMDNELDRVLNAVGMSSYKNPFKTSGVSDILLSIGWYKSSEITSPVQRLSVMMQAGVLLPTAGKKSLIKPFALPLGYDDFVGVNARGLLNVQVFNWLGVGVYGGGMVFFSENRDIRVKTDTNQNGWIFLQQSFGKVDYGSIWDICGYLQVDCKWLFAKVGYSYTRREDATLTIKDDTLLKNYINQQMNPPAPAPLASVTYPNVVSKDAITNTDKMLKAWEFYTLHAIVGFSPKIGSISPIIFVEYDYPTYGKYSFKTDMLGGSLNLMIKIDF